LCPLVPLNLLFRAGFSNKKPTAEAVGDGKQAEEIRL
jgi:hypothetical protein